MHLVSPRKYRNTVTCAAEHSRKYLLKLRYTHAYTHTHFLNMTNHLKHLQQLFKQLRCKHACCIYTHPLFTAMSSTAAGLRGDGALRGDRTLWGPR